MTNAMALQHQNVVSLHRQYIVPLDSQYVVSLHHQYIVPLHSQYVVPLRQRYADDYCVFGSIVVLTDPHIKLETQGGYLEVPQTGQEATSAHKPVAKCPKSLMKLVKNVCV